MKTKIYKEAWIGPNAKIGEVGCKIQPFAFIPDGVTIDDNVFVGPGVVFTNDKFPPSNGKGWKSTVVEEGVSIGANATILPGIVLRRGCRIGAGAVVTKDVPEKEVWVGNPAKLLIK